MLLLDGCTSLTSPASVLFLYGSDLAVASCTWAHAVCDLGNQLWFSSLSRISWRFVQFVMSVRSHSFYCWVISHVLPDPVCLTARLLEDTWPVSTGACYKYSSSYEHSRTGLGVNPRFAPLGQMPGSMGTEGHAKCRLQSFRNCQVIFWSGRTSAFPPAVDEASFLASSSAFDTHSIFLFLAVLIGVPPGLDLPFPNG